MFYSKYGHQLHPQHNNSTIPKPPMQAKRQLSPLDQNSHQSTEIVFTVTNLKFFTDCLNDKGSTLQERVIVQSIV